MCNRNEMTPFDRLMLRAAWAVIVLVLALGCVPALRQLGAL